MKTRNINLKVTRTVRDGHLSYSLEGNFEPLPCGNLVEARIRAYFKKITEPPTDSDGNFFRLIDRENHGTEHLQVYNRLYPPAKDGTRPSGITRDIKFVDLRPTSVLYNNLNRENADGIEDMCKEYREICEILESVEDGEETILIELN